MIRRVAVRLHAACGALLEKVKRGAGRGFCDGRELERREDNKEEIEKGRGKGEHALRWREAGADWMTAAGPDSRCRTCHWGHLTALGSEHEGMAWSHKRAARHAPPPPLSCIPLVYRCGSRAGHRYVLYADVNHLI